MLKYNLSEKEFGVDIINVDYDNYIITEDVDINSNYIYVTFTSTNELLVNVGDILTITDTLNYQKVDETYDSMVNIQNAEVIGINEIDKTFTIKCDKYKELYLEDVIITNEGIINGVNEEGINYRDVWCLKFQDIHGFTPEDIFLGISILFDNKICNLVTPMYVNCQTLYWAVSEDVEYLEELKNILYPYGVDNQDQAIVRNVRVLVNQQTFRDESFYNFNQSKPTITTKKFNVNIPISIESSNEVRLLHEENLNEYFIKDTINANINKYVEMEKQVYLPVAASLVNNIYSFVPIQKINFNLHFREHSGENWTVEDNDSWNCITKYNLQDPNQSDLLCFLDFKNNDVKYQKNKLKKSFLRLLFYDSPDNTNQNLLAYSTIYMDSAKLYSKFIRNQNTPGYINFNGDENLTGIRVDREIETFDENLRLSSQMTVENKWQSTRTSEGFYLYMWADNGVSVLPEKLYMKAEFNHAGYGRTIPMMAPYHKDGSGFKTKDEIKEDWDGDGYGIHKYLKYSYINMKYMYYKETGEYYYFLDPEIYGYNSNKVLNIDLYEARITF